MSTQANTNTELPTEPMDNARQLKVPYDSSLPEFNVPSELIRETCEPNYRKATPEERLKKGLMRVVQQCRLYYRLHESPMPLRHANRLIRLPNTTAADYFEYEPLKSCVMPLVRHTGGIFLIPLEAWQAMSYEDQALIRRDLLRKRGPGAPKKRGPKSKAELAMEARPNDIPLEITPTLSMKELARINPNEGIEYPSREGNLNE